MTEQLDELLQAYGKDREEQKRVAESRVVTVLSAIFAEISDLKFIRMIGSTPGFNDGDPCYHSQRVGVDVYDTDDVFSEYLYETDTEMARAEAIENDPNLALLSSHHALEWYANKYNEKTGVSERVPLPNDPFHVGIIKANILLDAVADEFETVYGTDWQLDIVRDPETEEGYRISVEGYDCGY